MTDYDSRRTGNGLLDTGSTPVYSIFSLTKEELVVIMTETETFCSMQDVFFRCCLIQLRYIRMMKSGETVQLRRRRGCRNSQAKGPVLDGTLERRAGTEEAIRDTWRIFQVRDRGADGEAHSLYLCFLWIKPVRSEERI